jgi:hypothetical protein
MTDVRLKLDEDRLSRMGSASLIGMTVSDDTKKVTLVFPQTSLSWREKHGGPAIYLIPEYVIACLIEDIVWMTKRGIEVIIETTTIDPEESK